MLTTYSRSEIIELWRRRHLYTPHGFLPADDDKAIDDHIYDEIRRWYANLLLTASASLLPCENLASEATVDFPQPNCASIVPPGRGVRLLSLRMSAWTAAATSFYLPGSTFHQLQNCFATRATIDAPVVIHTHSGYLAFGLPGLKTPEVIDPDTPAAGEVAAVSDSEAAAPPVIAPASLTELWMVAAPADGSFTFDDALIPDSPLQSNSF